MHERQRVRAAKVDRVDSPNGAEETDHAYCANCGDVMKSERSDNDENREICENGGSARNDDIVDNGESIEIDENREKDWLLVNKREGDGKRELFERRAK